jgi:hypothetical protein
LFAKGSDGFHVWVTNNSSSVVYIAFTGSTSLGDEEDPSRVTYRIDPATTDIPGPFIYVGDPGEGAATVLTESCDPVQAWTLAPGDFGVVIDVSGDATIHEYGFGQRPTTQRRLPLSNNCVGTS